ncbi:MAG: dihydrofolate reductase [Prevotellaceae bacterium]|nr:dihydrofolate reductase [Prevotellaceae bacterium]
MRLSIIVAIAKNYAIGLDNKLIYWLPNDMKRFRALTTGNAIIMGRKTFESLPKEALPNRRNIVLSRTSAKDAFPGAECYATLDEAIEACRNQDEVFIIGGASVYEQAFPIANRLCLTCVDDIPSEADTFFPEFDSSHWKETFREEHDIDEKHAFRYAFVNLERK